MSIRHYLLMRLGASLFFLPLAALAKHFCQAVAAVTLRGGLASLCALH
jgi:hypothetical protein